MERGEKGKKELFFDDIFEEHYCGRNPYGGGLPSLFRSVAVICELFFFFF